MGYYDPADGYRVTLGPDGNVLQPEDARYVYRGNCVNEPLDDIWAGMPTRSAITGNKRRLSVLS